MKIGSGSACGGRGSGSLEGEEPRLWRLPAGRIARDPLSRAGDWDPSRRDHVGEDRLGNAGRTGGRVVTVRVSVLRINGEGRPPHFPGGGHGQRRGRRVAGVGQRGDHHQALGEHRDRRQALTEGGREGSEPEPWMIGHEQ